MMLLPDHYKNIFKRGVQMAHACYFSQYLAKHLNFIITLTSSVQIMLRSHSFAQINGVIYSQQLVMN